MTEEREELIKELHQKNDGKRNLYLELLFAVEQFRGGYVTKKDTNWLIWIFDSALNVLKKLNKRTPEDIRKEVEELAEFHSKEIPCVWGDGEKTTEKMISLTELGYILSTVFDPEEE